MKSFRVLASVFPFIVLWSSTAYGSVELYGRIDLSINAIKFTDGASRPTISSDTSRYGIRGVEDLGDGKTAYFKLESGFNADTGTNANPNVYFNRETYVGLADRNFGSLQLGSQWTPAIWLTARIDPFQRGQMGAQFTLLQGFGARGYAIQYQNAVQYISPKIANFQGRVLYQLREGAAAANRAAGVDYINGKFSLGLVYDSTETTGASVALPSLANVRSNNIGIGASYDFTAVKTFAYAQQNHVEGLPKVTGYMLGAAVPIGAGEFRLSYSNTNKLGANANLLAIGYNHFLSKRTQVYATAAKLKNQESAKFGIFPSSSEGTIPTAGQNVRGIQLGIRHAF